MEPRTTPWMATNKPWNACHGHGLTVRDPIITLYFWMVHLLVILGIADLVYDTTRHLSKTSFAASPVEDQILPRGAI